MTGVVLKESTVVYARAHSTTCPHCEAQSDGWAGDPRGKETTCDECGKAYKVAEKAEVKLA